MEVKGGESDGIVKGRRREGVRYFELVKNYVGFPY